MYVCVRFMYSPASRREPKKLLPVRTEHAKLLRVSLLILCLFIRHIFGERVECLGKWNDDDRA